MVGIDISLRKFIMRFWFGVIVGILLMAFYPEMKQVFNESGMNDSVIETLQGLKEE